MTTSVDAAERDVEMLHVPVLRDEVVGWLTPVPAGAWVVDGTVGLGGHAAALLEHEADARLLGLDRDPAALELAGRRLRAFGPRVVLRHADFRHLGAEAQATGIDRAHAILLDLGLSSYQLERSDRGFSFQVDQRLDMRFDPTAGLTAAEILARTPEADLARLLWTYGEEPGARRIARTLCQARARAPIATSGQLADLVCRAARGGRHRSRIHPATRTFQALRMAVNDELGGLEAALPQAADLLGRRGRLAVIAFHSLEDRVVKRAFRGFAAQGFRVLTPKPVRPGHAEIQHNPRARSARLRVLERGCGQL